MEIGNSMALTVQAVSLALDAANLRQQVIADNVANAGAADHVRMRVDFEAQMQQALAFQSGDGAASLDGVHPDLVPDAVQGPVALDDEMAKLSANALTYHALTKALSRYMSIAGLIASSSKA